MSKKTVRRSITMTQEMRDRLALLVSKQSRDTTEADIIREAIRLYLDNQEDIIGSRKHFQKSLQDRLDRLEDVLQSKHVLAWTWVISPAPDLMALVPEEQRRDLVCDLTERIVEDYYLERGFGVPEYSYILHDREARMEDGGETMQQLHTHVVLPGTAPLDGVDRTAVYNNKERGHDVLFREIASRHFSEALDRIVGPDWQLLREEPEIKPELIAPDDLDAWFPRN